jgi:hypothetical protein
MACSVSENGCGSDRGVLAFEDVLTYYDAPDVFPELAQQNYRSRQDSIRATSSMKDVRFPAILEPNSNGCN